MTSLTQNTQAHTAIIDGKEVDADLAASIHEVRDIFDRLKKAMKTIGLYRHNTDRYLEYLEPVHTALADFLSRKGTLTLRLEALAFKFKGVVVFEDTNKENNLIYPFFAAGIRLFIFKAGLSPQELLDFLLLSFTSDLEGNRHNDDIVTKLWKAELESIEYVVVENFVVVADDDVEEVEVEIEKVIAYLYRQLQSNSDDYMRFARVSADDLELELNDVDSIRGAIVKGVTATAADKARVQSSVETERERVLPKLVTVFFQLLELDTTEESFEDVAEAFVQLLDALLIQENFTAIVQIRERFGVSMQKQRVSAAARDLIERCSERFANKMAEGQRIQTIGQILNQGLVKDPDGLQKYLLGLGSEAALPLLDMLETLELAPNRRLICDVLVDIGRDTHNIFVTRLTHPSSNVVKDMLYIIDKINPPEKFAIFAHVLKHPNAILRLETLSIIGRNPSDECFAIVKKVFTEHEDSQMRATAARHLANFDAAVASKMLLEAANANTFEKRPEPERKAIFTGLALSNTDDARGFLQSALQAKAGLLNKKKVDELKMLAIIGLEANPSVPTLHLLAEAAQDTKRNSEEIAAAARDAAIKMKSRLLGR